MDGEFTGSGEQTSMLRDTRNENDSGVRIMSEIMFRPKEGKRAY